MGGGAPTDAVGAIVTYLLSFGLPGVCLIAIGWAYIQKDKRVEQLQDLIIKMAGDQATAMVGATNAINGNTAIVNSLRDMLIARAKGE